ncbi:MAG: 30S ribosome-binding factor RbfA [Alphaproteobacteria bacterium]|nr:30S ribosome-binding factor RbfA [Alphaproteobacteria bacterium]
MGKGRASAPSQRQLRVGEELRHVLAQIIGRGIIRDPDLTGVAITVTEVRVSPDLRNATVMVVPLGGDEMDQMVTALGRAASFLRREVAREITLRNVPALTFQGDASFDAAARIDDLLRRPEIARDLIGVEEDDGA